LDFKILYAFYFFYYLLSYFGNSSSSFNFVFLHLGSGVTGGKPELIETIAKAGIAVGADGLFIETHPNPSEAKSDGANMLQLDLLEDLLSKLVRIREAIS